MNTILKLLNNMRASVWTRIGLRNVEKGANKNKIYYVKFIQDNSLRLGA